MESVACRFDSHYWTLKTEPNELDRGSSPEPDIVDFGLAKDHRCRCCSNIMMQNTENAALKQ